MPIHRVMAARGDNPEVTWRSSYVRIARAGDGFRADGDPSVSLGTKLDFASEHGPEGVFAEWSWDGGRLTVTNDRFGLYPLFYTEGDGKIVVSPSLVRLVELGAPAALDYAALAVFRYLGFFLGEDTAFRGIKVLPPGSRLEWDGRLRLDVPDRPLGGQIDPPREDAIAEYVRLFRRAVERRLTDEPFALPLSGGRDSRHILLELVAAGCRPSFCVTTRRYPPGGSDEREVAAALARRLGIEHVYVEPPPRFGAELRKNVETHFGTQEHAWFVGVADAMAARVSAFYDGIAGDVLSASLFQNSEWLRLYAEGRLPELAELLGESGGRTSLDPVLRKDPERSPAEVEHAVRETIVAELARYAGAANPLSMFFFWNRTRRAIALAPFGLFASVPTCLAPFVDHELYDFLASLPAELMVDRTFHTDTIAAAHPDFADVPYDRKLDERAGVGEAASLVGSTLAYGIRTRPARLAEIARADGQSARYAVSSSYRRRYRPKGPTSYLYLWQLENLAALEPGRP